MAGQHAGVELERIDHDVTAIEALTVLVEAHGGARIGVRGLAARLVDDGRRLRRTFAPTPRLLGRKVTAAFTWEAHDRRDRTWWPQGITTSALTGFAEAHGHDVLVTSWYSKAGEGARVSVVDLEHRRYAHVLLVEPVLGEHGLEVRPVKVHAGGLVWHGRHLHVAATARGFVTFDVDDLLRVPEGLSSDSDSGSDPAVTTFGHRYVLPARSTHRGHALRKEDRLRFSFLSLDRSGPEPALVVGEYGSPQQSRRVARFALDPATLLPVVGDSGRSAAEIDDRGEARMQGVVVIDGTCYVTRSRGPATRGSVYVGTPGAFREHRRATPIGPEDVVWWPESASLWTVTEHPRRRWIAGMRRSGLPGR